MMGIRREREREIERERERERDVGDTLSCLKVPFQIPIGRLTHVFCPRPFPQ